MRTHYQVMVWMGVGGIQPTDWGWREEEGRLVPQMIEKSPAPEALLKMIHCNCTSGCETLRCTCLRYGLDCTSACGSCQDRQCENIVNVSPLDDDDDDAGDDDE